MKEKIIAIMLVAVLFGMAGASIFLQDRVFSDQENRNLEQMPELTWGTLADGSFMADLEKYLSDQVPLRDFWVKSRDSLLLALGQRQIQEVYFGDSGQLFQLHDISLDQAEKNLAYIKAWAEQQKDVPITFVLAPTAASVYSEQLPEYVQTYDQRELAAAVRDGLGERVQFVDLYDTLTEHKEEKIYFASDHHWTMLGAFYAWEYIFGGAGSWQSEVAGENFYGSLYSQVPIFGYEAEKVEIFTGLSDAVMSVERDKIENHPLIWEENFSIKDQYTAFMGGNYGEMVVTNPEAPERTLLLFKDSYANVMIPFLAEEYSEIHVVDLRYNRNGMVNYMADKEIDEVFFLYNADFLATDANFGWLSIE